MARISKFFNEVGSATKKLFAGKTRTQKATAAIKRNPIKSSLAGGATLGTGGGGAYYLYKRKKAGETKH